MTYYLYSIVVAALFPFGYVKTAVTCYDACEIGYLIADFGYWRSCSFCSYTIVLRFMPYAGLAEQFRNNLRIHVALRNVSVLVYLKR